MARPDALSPKGITPANMREKSEGEYFESMSKAYFPNNGICWPFGRKKIKESIILPDAVGAVCRVPAQSRKGAAFIGAVCEILVNLER